MNLNVIDSDSKNALLTITGKKVKLKVNRNWSESTIDKVVRRATSISKTVIDRKIGYSVSAELIPDSMNNAIVLRSKSNKEIRVQ